MGLPLMPWQLQVAMVGGEIDTATGRPAYRDVVVTVPRQSGKTTLILAWEIQRALGWGAPQKIIYSAQDGSAARKKLLEDQAPILEPRKAKLGIRRILKGAGNEAVEFRNGSRIGLMASGEDSGHGKTIHLAIKDEFFADFDDRRDQSLGPAMLTVATAQKLTASTMGTEASVPLNDLVERGRRAVLEGETAGIAYFEWSAEPDADLDDEDVWWGCMPALGITQTVEAVRHERQITFAGKPSEFRRAYLNVSTKSDERVIPAQVWDLVNSPSALPTEPITFGLDINPDRTAASIVAVGDRVVELVEHQQGTVWLIERAVDMNSRTPGCVWAHDASPSAPVASVIPDLERAGLQMLPVKGSDLAAACGSFVIAVVDSTVKVRRHPDLDAAVAAAGRRMQGDAWTWARRGTIDISPLVAATVALWASALTVEPGFVDLSDYLD